MGYKHELPCLVVSAEFDVQNAGALHGLSPDKAFAFMQSQTERDAAELYDLVHKDCRGLPVVVKVHDLLDDSGAKCLAKKFPVLRRRGGWMVDLKFSDIDPTVYRRVLKSAAWLRPSFITVKTESGIIGMQSAVSAAALVSKETRVAAVGPLTSLDDHDTRQLYGVSQIMASLIHLGKAYDAGIRTMVAGIPELEAIKGTSWGQDPELVLLVPGIHAEGANPNPGQKRSGTIREAIAAGGHAVIPIIGRAIMKHPHEGNRRRIALESMVAEVTNARAALVHNDKEA